jgi:3-methyladenine DNA glycosylase AlkC
LTEERRLRIFENRVLRKIFGPKGDEVTGQWRKIHNEELHALYSSGITTTTTTPWSRVLPEELKRPELLKKFPAFFRVIN